MKLPFKPATILVSAMLLASPGNAQGQMDNYAQQLANQGYANIEVSRTMLGRGKIQATRNNETREIVVSATGRILSDTTEDIAGALSGTGRTNK
ncbi:MAG: hypothetical protein KUG74_07495, partial [Rhodobacteraceae bacterium]|nr:hypothetical protein [Paracoccaceae bacterium]